MISVIICTYNREKYIYNVLSSLAHGTFPAHLFEIVLVDNNCTDGTHAEVDRFCADNPSVTLRYFVETNQGLSHARNRGIKESKGDILVYVDDDATVNTEYLATYADWFDKHPETDAAGGPIIPHYETGSEPRWMTYFIKRLLTGYLYFGNKPGPFPGDNYPGGGNAAYRSRVFEKVGLYNVELGRNGDSLGGGEEKDIFDKMRALGMHIYYLPTAILYHIIPERKLTDDYFNRVSYGIGQSERYRTKSISESKYRKRLFQEAVKWCGTLALWLGFAVRGQFKKGNKLVVFRKMVSKGLIEKQKQE